MNVERQMNRQALQALREEEQALEEKLEREMNHPAHPVALDVPWVDLPDGPERPKLRLRW